MVCAEEERESGAGPSIRRPLFWYLHLHSGGSERWAHVPGVHSVKAGVDWSPRTLWRYNDGLRPSGTLAREWHWRRRRWRRVTDRRSTHWPAFGTPAASLAWLKTLIVFAWCSRVCCVRACMLVMSAFCVCVRLLFNFPQIHHPAVAVYLCVFVCVCVYMCVFVCVTAVIIVFQYAEWPKPAPVSIENVIIIQIFKITRKCDHNHN